MVSVHGRSGANLRESGCDPFPQDGPPQCPEELSDAAKAKWELILSQFPNEALRAIDVHQLAILSNLLERFDELIAMPADDLAAGRLLLATAAHIHRLSAAYGLTPADRQRLNIDVEIQDDAAEWLASCG